MVTANAWGCQKTNDTKTEIQQLVCTIAGSVGNCYTCSLRGILLCITCTIERCRKEEYLTWHGEHFVGLNAPEVLCARSPRAIYGPQTARVSTEERHPPTGEVLGQESWSEPTRQTSMDNEKLPNIHLDRKLQITGDMCKPTAPTPKNTRPIKRDAPNPHKRERRKGFAV